MRKALLLGVAAALAFAGSALAQETTSGSIAGRVVDPQGAAVPGATVTVITPQGEKVFTTDQTGRFLAPYIVPGVQTVRVELPGFKTVEQKDVVVRLGQRITLNFTLEVSQVQEVVEVVGASPVIDLSSTTAGGVLDSDQLKSLPVGRNFTQTLYLVPGVSDSSGVGNANPSIGGASGLDNNYIVDGVNISNTGFGGVGVYTIVFGSLGSGVTTDFIKETQVKTAGFEAEYGQATGGVVNVITKSGTNEFHGNLYGYWAPDWLESNWKQLQTPNGTINTTATNNADVGLSLGGPLVRDKVFFFGSFNPQWQKRTAIAPEGYPLQSLGEVTRDRRVMAYAGKVSWQASPNHRFDISAFGDPSHGPNGPQRLSSLLSPDTTRFSELKTYGGHNQSLRYDGILSPSWFVEASVAHAQTFIEEIPSANLYQITDYTTSPIGFSGGLGYYDQKTDGKNWQYSLKSTNIFNGAGSHQLRYGVQFEDIEYQRATNRTGPPFTLPDGTLTRTGGSVQIRPDDTVPGGAYYRVTRANFGTPPLTTQKYLNWFAQDTWQIANRLTLKLGVRWEKQTLEGGTPLCYANESQVGAGDGTGELINCKYTWSNNWSPRLGFIWDVTGTGKSKLYANWGRFYVKVPNDLADRALSADSGISRADYYDANLTQPIPEGVLVGGVTRHYIPAGLAPSLFANDTKSTYTDEFLAGFEYEVAPSFSMGVRYIHRNLSTVLEDYAQASPVMYDAGYPGLGSVEYIIDNISKDLVTLNPADTPGFEYIQQPFFEDPEHKYDAVEVTANKSLTNHWSLFASYRWSRLKGNFEGFFRSDNGQSDPSITSLFDFPTNDPSYTAIGVPVYGYSGDIRYQGTTLGAGRLPNDRTHQFKIYASWNAGNLNLGAGLNMGSGRILTGLAANPTYSNSGEIPLTLRGGGIQTLDGFKDATPFETTLDLHADYAIRLGSQQQRLVLIGDVFNLFNNQDPLWYDVNSELGFASPNPNFGYATNGGGSAYPSYRAPLSVRIGARLEF